jgi:glucose/arabinose dehydrogenase
MRCVNRLRHVGTALVVGACALGGVGVEHAQAQDVANFAVALTPGFNETVLMVSPPGEPNRILIGTVRGVVRVIENGVLLPTPFLDISARTLRAHGLIGIAFPPDYATSRRFYINYTPLERDPAGPRIARYTTSANPNVANTEEEPLLDHGLGTGDHNSGWMGFGPDGYLYIARGDVSGVPQSPDYYQGKILRLDVSPATGYVNPTDNMFVGTSGLGEVAAIGLRNPWRCGFDSLTGDFYIADVGNLSQEEINYVPAGTLVGKNFGWPCMEGTLCTKYQQTCDCTEPGLTLPVHTYSHVEGYAIIGGTVYRGSAIPRWRGRYVFLDWFNGKFWSMRVVNGVATDVREQAAELNEGLPANAPLFFGSSFGTDADGEIYVTELRGRLLKIVPEFDGADWNMDGAVNSSDFFAFLTDFFDGNAEMTGDHVTNSSDFFEFLRYFFGS